MGNLAEIFDPSKQDVKRLRKIVNKILALDMAYSDLSDAELIRKTEEFKRRLLKGETLDDILIEAFATVREGAYRSIGLKPFPVQLIGGMVMNEGNIAEMRTGEGKTLVATLPAYLNALEGKGVYVVTVNDYLAKRDMELMGKVHQFLGLRVGLITRGQSLEEKKVAYEADITYGTNNEFGFDYLRDNMAISKDQQVQRGLNYAIIDEVDSVLIDEARTPLIIAGPGTTSSSLYKMADNFVGLLSEDDFEKDEKLKSVQLTEKGIEKAENFFSVENITDFNCIELFHCVQKALHAHKMMQLDKDYIVVDGEVIIVDEFTGRTMPGRRFSDGLHQAIEAKENVKINAETKTIATITFQNYFRMFNKLAGMTGTAKTEEDEFSSIYNLNVVTIPTNRPMIRIDQTDLVYVDEETKFRAVVNEIEKRHQIGQPVLIGTVSIEKSEKLSHELKAKNVQHSVLNAKYHEQEAEIIAGAGQYGAVTIATNMAGRGTDIVLGKGVAELGGLYVVGTERHESRRIDNQLRGRSGRQGDPGESRFFLSLEDTIMRVFGSERLHKYIEQAEVGDAAFESKMISKSIETAQKQVEAKNFESRKNVLKFDNIMNKQREIIYEQRQSVLDGIEIQDQIFEMLQTTIENYVDTFLGDAQKDYWDIEGFKNAIDSAFHIRIEVEEEDTKKSVLEKLENVLREHFSKIRKDIGDEAMNQVESGVLLKIVDMAWMDHIDNMDQLKQGMSLRSYGNNDPVKEYTREGFAMFEEMIQDIKENTIKYLMNIGQST
ncbi:preprotein translocase subunit SecA [Eubacterium callanderi]|jgi:preprotein translocase subunit SecA|uniref:preprotein translocase subunit SecA n=1 Tax=Eubacterium callanderi TaxID=53442 RepID=UPI001D147DA5|nr:preprotein translocase subunit SecA [Eubacterium callanderi]MCC3402636.1 preprotein translocase subunit SecA [Eubacterium callanderi]